MKTILESIEEKNYTSAQEQLHERLREISVEKLHEMKKMIAARNLLESDMNRPSGRYQGGVRTHDEKGNPVQINQDDQKKVDMAKQLRDQIQGRSPTSPTPPTSSEQVPSQGARQQTGGGGYIDTKRLEDFLKEKKLYEMKKMIAAKMTEQSLSNPTTLRSVEYAKRGLAEINTDAAVDAAKKLVSMHPMGALGVKAAESPTIRSAVGDLANKAVQSGVVDKAASFSPAHGIAKKISGTETPIKDTVNAVKSTLDKDTSKQVDETTMIKHMLKRREKSQ